MSVVCTVQCIDISQIQSSCTTLQNPTPALMNSLNSCSKHTHFGSPLCKTAKIIFLPYANTRKIWVPHIKWVRIGIYQFYTVILGAAPHEGLLTLYCELPLTRGYWLYIGSCPSRRATDSILRAAPQDGLLTHHPCQDHPEQHCNNDSNLNKRWTILLWSNSKLCWSSTRWNYFKVFVFQEYRLQNIWQAICQ